MKRSDVREQARLLRFAASTRKTYMRWAEEFKSWQRAVGAEGEITEDVLIDFACELYLQNRGGCARQAVCGVRAMLAPKLKLNETRAICEGLSAQWRAEGGGRPQRDLMPRDALLKFATCRPKGYKEWDWIRDRALALVCTRLMLRPGEARALNMTDLKWNHDGANRGWAWFRIIQKKNDQFGDEGLKKWTPIEPSLGDASTLKALREWIALRGSHEGFMWCRKDGTLISADHINQLAKTIAAHSNLSGVFSGYSFRIAGATLGAAGGMSIATIQAVGGWKSEAVLRYLRGMGAAVEGASSRIGI